MWPGTQFDIFKTYSFKYAYSDSGTFSYRGYYNDLLHLSNADALIVNAVSASVIKPVSIVTADKKNTDPLPGTDTSWLLSDLALSGDRQSVVEHPQGNTMSAVSDYDLFLSSRFKGRRCYSIPLYKYKELVGIVTMVYAGLKQVHDTELTKLFLLNTIDLLYALPAPVIAQAQETVHEDFTKTTLVNGNHANDILQSIDDVMWFIDLTSGEHFYGNNADRILGYTSAELMQDKDLWWKIIHPEDMEQVIYKYDLVSQSTSKAEFEYRATRKDGTEVNIYTRIKIKKNEAGQPVKVLGIFSDITGLRNTERRLNHAQAIARIGSWEFDLKTRDFSWSKQHYQLFELSGVSNEALYDAYRQKIFAGDLAELDKVIDTSIRLGIPYEFEYRIWCASEDVKYILSLGECVKNEKDEVIGLRGTSQDITERKKIEAKLAYQNKQIMELTEAVNHSAMVTRNDASGSIVFANDLFCHISGYQFYELVNQNDRIFNSGYHSSDFWKQLWDTISSGQIWKGEIKNMRRDGTYYWVYTVINPIKDEEGNVEEYLVIRFDITERKNAEMELAYVKKQTEEIISNTDGAMWSVNAEGECLFVNYATARLTGYSIGELMNNKLMWTILVTPDEKMQTSDLYQSIFKTRDVSEIENSFRLMTKSGERKWVSVKSRAMINDANELMRVDSIITDITRQVKYEEQIKQAMEKAEYANIAKTEFLANISHEIRTPMNAILGFADLLKGSALSNEHEKYLDGILAGGKGLMSLINDILDLSKIEAGKMEIQKSVVDIRAMMKELDSVFIQKARSKKLKLIHTTEAAVPNYVLVDEVRLRQILFNLIGNAIKFTNTGTVSTYTGSSQMQDGSIKLDITISDTGIGIPKAQQEIVFEPFRQMDGQSTRRYGGTGLGLAITRRLVQMMNGSLEIESEVNKGTTISICLKEIEIAWDEEKSEQEDEDLTEISFLGQTILLVEDVESNREIIKGFLKPFDVSIIEVENGEHALTQMETVTPSLILMDMMMPVMDGYLTTKKIRSMDKFSKVPIIAITAFALSHNENEIRELCDDYIRKPFTKRELLGVIKNYLTHSPKRNSGNIFPGKSNAHEKMAVRKNTDPRDKELFYEKWKAVERLQSIDDIQGFAQQLMAYASLHDNRELLEYSQRLLDYADKFDIENLMAVFHEFPNSI